MLDVDRVAAQSLAEHREDLRGLMPEAVSAQGEVSTRTVMNRMFESAALRQALEKVLLPTVRTRIEAWSAQSTKRTALDSALLFEAGLDVLCETTLALTCPAEIRRARVLQRTTASAALFETIEAAQWPEAKKVELATLTLATDCELSELERRVEALSNHMR